MAVVDAVVSFSAVGTTKTAASFSERIGLRPTRLAEIGDLRGNGRFGRRHETALWWLDQECRVGAREPPDDALLGAAHPGRLPGGGPRHQRHLPVDLGGRPRPGDHPVRPGGCQ